MALSLPFRTLARGLGGNAYETAEVFAVRDADGLARCWRLLNAGSDQPPPEVDWTAEMVLVVTLGFCPTTGYWVRIKEVVPVATALEVRCREGRPAGMAGEMVTYPFHAVAVAARDSQLRLVRRVVLE